MGTYQSYGLLLLLCILHTLQLPPTYGQVELPACKNKKIYILDLNDFAGDNPLCHVDDIAVVNPGNGIVYTPDARLGERVSHKHGTHSAPWCVLFCRL